MAIYIYIYVYIYIYISSRVRLQAPFSLWYDRKHHACPCFEVCFVLVPMFKSARPYRAMLETFVHEAHCNRDPQAVSAKEVGS